MNLHIPDVRILEVHPAPWSNPRHGCRPSSMLEERNDPGLPLLLLAVRDAANLGYNFLSVAGDDPLGYPGLQALCREAHRHGMLTSTITVSASLEAARLEWLRFAVDLLGVEMEGNPDDPNRLAAVRTSGIPFAIVFPLTSASLPELESAAEFAVAQGAAMLQVRPSPELTGDQMAKAWTMAERLRDLQHGRLAIHFDAVNLYSLPAEPEDLAAWKRDLEREARRLGEFVSPLVIERDGAVAPMCYGFPRGFAFGNLREQRLEALAEWWIESRAGAFCKLYSKVLQNTRSSGHVFGDLVQMLSLEALRGGNGMSAAG